MADQSSEGRVVAASIEDGFEAAGGAMKIFNWLDVGGEGHLIQFTVE
jgi:hypothetical protein